VASDGNSYTLKDRIPYSILNNPPNVGRANMYVTDEQTTYFCLNGGIGKYMFAERMPAEKKSLYISTVEYYDRKNDRTFYLDPRKNAIIAYQHNDIGFQFMYPEYTRKTFRVVCYLDGYDSRWISTDENLSITYNNLPANDYILKARVLDISGMVLSSVSFSFRIKNPWYKTGWAYLSYVLIILLITALFIQNHVQKIVQKKNKLFTEQENRRLAQLEKQEKEITRLRNERLEADLTHKSKELASATMMIINHAEFLNNLRSHIQTLMLSGKINRTEGNALLTMIGSNLSEEDAWTVFQENFDLIHENFFRKLKERYPSLTPTDLKLCTLLRLNYSSKEIAGMMNISIRGVEAARYRLRKKLNLSETENLVDFMIKFK
jgi:DNA-binding CsgD family transcriptional regulator